MKSTIVTIAATATCAMAAAQEFGQVLSSTPVTAQQAVPRQVCQQASVLVPQPTSGAGTAIGAIAGAAIGSSIGHGGGRVVGTVIGMVGGAAIGHQIDSQDNYQTRQVQRCTTHTVFENRVVHYDVVYTYAGRQYAVQMPYDPGPTVQVQVTPVGVPAPAMAPIATAPPMAAAPTITTIHSSVDYVPYVAPNHVAPVIIALPPLAWGHPPRHQRHSHRPMHPHLRDPGHGHQPRWR